MAGVASHRVSGRPREAKPGPAEGKIVDPRRLREVSRNGHADGFGVQMRAQRPLSYDTDISKHLAKVSVALAEHFRDSMLAGQQPDGSGSLPAASGARVAPFLGVRTGYFAQNWLLTGLSGSETKGRRAIKAFDRRDYWAVPGMLRKQGLKLISTKGTAQVVIHDTFRAVALQGFGELKTPSKVERKAGRLPQVKERVGG